MPDPSLALAGAGGLASGIGALFGGHAQSAAAKRQAQSLQEALDFQKGVYADQTKNNQPFIDAGHQGVEGLLGLLTSEGRANSLEEFYAGDEFATLNQQSRDATFAGAAGEGSLGGSASRNDLQRIAPNLGINNLNQEFSRFGSLAGLGAGVSGQQGGFASQQGGSIAAILAERGKALGQQDSAYSEQFGQAFGTAGGYALGKGLEGAF